MIYIPAQFTDEEFSSAKSRSLLSCKCKNCGKLFLRSKHDIQSDIKAIKLNPSSQSGFFCCSECASAYKSIQQLVICEQCGKEFYRKPSQILNHVFCSHSCAAIYNNTHKATGYHRSAIELHIESNLLMMYPNTTFIFNDRNICNGYELDIYIPKLHLAIELNGIIHYKPIYGTKKLKHTQYKDYCKQQFCQMKDIKLIIIDISNINHFTDDYKTKVLNLVCSFIDNKK